VIDRKSNNPTGSLAPDILSYEDWYDQYSLSMPGRTSAELFIRGYSNTKPLVGILRLLFHTIAAPPTLRV
jgi:hypothetical protein